MLGFSWRGGDGGGLRRLGSGLEPRELRSAAARAVRASFAELDRLEVGALYRSDIHSVSIAEKTAPFSSECFFENTFLLAKVPHIRGHKEKQFMDETRRTRAASRMQTMPNGHRRVGLRPGTPVPSAGLRPANGVPVPVQCCIVCILERRAAPQTQEGRTRVTPGERAGADCPGQPTTSTTNHATWGAATRRQKEAGTDTGPQDSTRNGMRCTHTHTHKRSEGAKYLRPSPFP